MEVDPGYGGAQHFVWRGPLMRRWARKCAPEPVCVRKLEGHTDWVSSVAWSPCGSKIASGSADRKIRVWNAETGGSVKLGGHIDVVWSVAWSLCGFKIVSGAGDNTVRVRRILEL